MARSYVDSTDYSERGCGTLPEDEIEKRLQKASSHIDSLTFNRICAIGFDNLTKWQQDIVKDACCMQADFEYENEDMLETTLTGYDINGVSVTFGSSANIYTQNGVTTSQTIYSVLEQSGLCCRIL